MFLVRKSEHLSIQPNKKCFVAKVTLFEISSFLIQVRLESFRLYYILSRNFHGKWNFRRLN